MSKFIFLCYFIWDFQHIAWWEEGDKDLIY